MNQSRAKICGRNAARKAYEFDVITDYRHIYAWTMRAGTKKSVRRQISRRERRMLKADLRKDIECSA